MASVFSQVSELDLWILTDVDETRIETLRASRASWRAVAQQLGIGRGNRPPNRAAAFQKLSAPDFLRTISMRSVPKCLTNSTS